MKLITMPRVFLGLASLILILDFPVPEKGWGADDSKAPSICEGTPNDCSMLLHCADRNTSKPGIAACCERKVGDCREECDKREEALRKQCYLNCNRAKKKCDEYTGKKDAVSLPGQPGFKAPSSGGVQQTPRRSPFSSRFNIQQFMQRFSLRPRGIETLPPLVIPDPIPPTLPNFELEKKKP